MKSACVHWLTGVVRAHTPENQSPEISLLWVVVEMLSMGGVIPTRTTSRASASQK